MELVHGLSITEFCDEQRLTNRRRLELFVAVCNAVQHAHQKGIIHRDLKPSNIMVTMHDDNPVPKVIDFGVSKALSQKLTDKTLYTAYGQMVGTPLYMSPEQAQMSGLDVDTRSDVFSLGVLLYELLTGTTPFDRETLKKADFEELRRIIREDEPPRPSDRVSTLNAELISTVSDRRKVDRRGLGQSLRGELDWVVMRAMEKDRSRRYQSVSELSLDVQRYLRNEPVAACPPSIAYRFQKFAQRNKRAVIAFSLAAVSLIALTIGAVSFGRSMQTEARHRADVNQKLKSVMADLRRFESRMQQAPLDDNSISFSAKMTIERATALSRNDLADRDLATQVKGAVANLKAAGIDRELLIQLEEIRTQFGGLAALAGQARSIGGQKKQLPAYRDAFSEHGITPIRLPPKQAARRIAEEPSRVRQELEISLWVWWGYYSYF